MLRAYVWAKPENILQFKTVRDEVWKVTKAEEYYVKKEPHITLIPPFSVKDGCKKDVKETFESFDIVGCDICVGSLSVYQNIHLPFVVMVNIEMSCSDKIDQLRDELSQFSRGNPTEVDNHHITLFKTQGWWSEIDDFRKRILQNEIMGRPRMKNTEVGSAYLNFRS